jgi:hypothetical protein
MAPKRTKAKSGSGYSRVETNIYREVRSDAALRFRVSVYPLKPVTKACDLADEADGLDWGRGVRLELLRQKRSPSGSSADQSPADTSNERPRQPTPPSAVGKPFNGSHSPEAVTVDTILTNAVSKVMAPSTQKVRHELRVLRSACKSNFRAGQWAKTRGWLAATPLMTIALPAGAQPRQRRISAGEEQRLLEACHSPVARFAIRFALSETCRRSELVSLRWEDVDLERSVLQIRRPAGQRKSKTRDRLLPLTPEPSHARRLQAHQGCWAPRDGNSRLSRYASASPRANGL